MFSPLSRIGVACLLFCSLLPVQCAAQSNPPILFSVRNSASYDSTGIAQGSLFVVFGANIGPSRLVQATSFPLPSQIGGTSMTVTSGSTALSCPMVYSSAGQAAAILPSNTALGPDTIQLTYNGAQSPYPAMIVVAQAAVGLYALSSSGLGPGVFTSADNSVKTFAASAKPGEVITAWQPAWAQSTARTMFCQQPFRTFQVSKFL